VDVETEVARLAVFVLVRRACFNRFCDNNDDNDEFDENATTDF